MKKYFWNILNILGYNVVMFFLRWFGNRHHYSIPEWWVVMQITVNIFLVYFLWKQIRIYRKHQQLKWLDSVSRDEIENGEGPL